MAKKENFCGRAHGLLDEIFGCSKCEKEKKRLKKVEETRRLNAANDQSPTFNGWRMGNNWSGSRRRQFPRGLPPEDD